jgi:hypothetical protein
MDIICTLTIDKWTYITDEFSENGLSKSDDRNKISNRACIANMLFFLYVNDEHHLFIKYFSRHAFMIQGDILLNSIETLEKEKNK